MWQAEIDVADVKSVTMDPCAHANLRSELYWAVLIILKNVNGYNYTVC